MLLVCYVIDLIPLLNKLLAKIILVSEHRLPQTKRVVQECSFLESSVFLICFHIFSLLYMGLHDTFLFFFSLWTEGRLILYLKNKEVTKIAYLSIL